MITENLTCDDFERRKHLIYGKALLDFAKGVTNEYIRARGDAPVLLRFIEKSKIEANGKVFPTKFLWSLFVDCYEPAPEQLTIRHCAILDFSNCLTYRDVCLHFEHSYFQIYQASKSAMFDAEISVPEVLESVPF